MAIQLITLGGLHIVSDDGELDWLLAQHTRAALLVYLAVERRISRESLAAFFWPESDAENARHALRQSLYHLRKAVGVDWVESRAHELVVTGDIRADVDGFIAAIERDEIALATELYRGPFLNGVHLVDLTSWETWVDGRRAQYARAFRKAARGLVDSRRAAGDLTGAVEAAELWAARDPSDDEAQHRLIEALATAGERAEAIRQYEAYARVLEPDGLQPLDETIALVDRLRAEPSPLPAVRAAAPTARPAPNPAVVEPASHAELAVPATRRTRWVAPAALALIILVTVVWGVRRRSIEAAPSSDAGRIAVLPFSVRGAQSVAYLGDGMVNLLGAALDGAGSLRRVDTRALFAAASAAGTTVADRQRAEEVAARLGAAMYVLGDVVEAGGQLQIEAAVYGRGVEPNARATVNGPADSVFALVDRLAARLLGGLGDPKADRLRRTAATTTTSLPALKAYLEGERLMRAGQFEQAADAYTGAIGMDSTFALAHYRLALAREWAPLPGEDDAAAAAARNGARLSARDHDLLEAFREWRSGNATRAERAYRTMLARYPDDLDAWFQLAEIEFHHGPLFGRPIEKSEEAWRRVISYEPRNLFAINHLARLLVVSGRGAALTLLIAPFSPEERRNDRRLVEIELLQAVARRDTAAARALAADARRWEPLAVWRAAAWLTAFSPDDAVMRDVLRDLSDGFADASLRADLHWFGAMLDLASGRLRAGRASLSKAEESERDAEPAKRRPGFGAVTEWYAATLPLPYADSTLGRLRRETGAWPPLPPGSTSAFRNEIGLGAPIQLEPLRQYTLGTLSSRLRDTAAAVAAAARLQQLAAAPGATTLVRDLDRGLRARIAWQAGRSAEALRLLEALEAQDSQGDIAVIPFVSRANERFLHGEVLASVGRDEEALAWFASLGDGSVPEIPFRALAHERQSVLYDRLGKRDEAAKHAARVAELWRDADPDLRR